MVGCCECGNEPPSSIKCGYVACFLPGRAKDLSAPLCLMVVRDSVAGGHRF